MKIARVTGLVTATVKESQLSGRKLLVVDIVDGAGKVQEAAVAATDTCGAGPGDMVLVAMGSAARLPGQTSGIATDATIVAIIDEINLGGSTAYSAG